MNRYKRPEVKQITRQWVKERSHMVTDRDVGLLTLLMEHRLLRRDQIEKLYPEFPSTHFLNKRLKTLYERHFIDRIYPTVGLGNGSSKQHVCLDRAGIIYLDIEGYNKPIKTDKDGNKSLPLGWEHIVMLNEYQCKAREFFNGEHGSLKHYWTELPHHYKDTKIIPDITFVATHKGKGYVFFIEVDLGTEDIPYVKKKLDSYIDYYMSKRWVSTQWAKLFKTPVFPRILFLTENGRSKRIDTLREYVKDSSLRFHIDEHDNIFNVWQSIVKG